MKCEKCGNNINPNEKFCTNCGNPVPVVEQPTQEVVTSPVPVNTNEQANRLCIISESRTKANMWYLIYLQSLSFKLIALSLIVKHDKLFAMIALNPSSSSVWVALLKTFFYL